MAGPFSSQSNSLLSGLFGVLQSASAARSTTADIWSSLRQAAGTWQWQASGQGEIPSTAELEANGAQVLRQQGVTIQTVNTYRALAGQWRSAKAALSAADEEDQITHDMIYTPPWSRTAAQGVPDRYRLRVQWQVTPEEGDAYTTWGSYEFDSPLTSLGDLLDQAGALVAKNPTSEIPAGDEVTGALDYELEQV